MGTNRKAVINTPTVLSMVEYCQPAAVGSFIHKEYDLDLGFNIGSMLTYHHETGHLKKVPISDVIKDKYGLVKNTSVRYILTAKGKKALKDGKKDIMSDKDIAAIVHIPNPHKTKSKAPALNAQASSAVESFIGAMELGHEAIATVRQMVSIGQAFLSKVDQGEMTDEQDTE